ncbi:hypothetical protein [Trueperella bialowiezensis]|uniref:Uncharacterized protein n=1 Tax=Trueperella bialowiezensis TaxID=312285 RepID=A0A3S4VH43_9ACTO|nr:hypothetical protein [Trueperella bialowiezensis]VEI13957.1 Uncharacterised protein [Trueperella bialowiezensis]
MTNYVRAAIRKFFWPCTDNAEAGDVPGWVMITLMTAALVVLIWAIAGPALTDLFNNAINRILSI